MTIHARNELARRYTPRPERDRIARELASVFAEDHTHLFVLNESELTALWKQLQARRGLSDNEIEAEFLSLTGIQAAAQSEGYEIGKTGKPPIS